MFDFPKKTSLYFQDPATPIAEGIFDLHNVIIIFLLGILGTVLWKFFRILTTSNYLWEFPTKNHIKTYRENYLKINTLIHGTTLEILWTITPT